MNKRTYALALSLSMLAALPAHAQMRGSASTPVAAAPAPSVSAARPNVSLSVFIGPAFELGNRALMVDRTTTVTESRVVTGNDAVNSTTVKPTDKPATRENGLGVMYGLDATWWGGSRFGLGAGLFGANVWGTTSTEAMHLFGQSTDALKGTSTTSNNTTDTRSVSDTMTISTPFANYGATITAPAANAANTVFTTSYTRNGGNILTLRQGDSSTAANTPKSTYAAEGGMAYSVARSFMVNDLTFHGDYVLADGPMGTVSFFGGVTMPIGAAKQETTAKTVKGDKAEGAAKQTETQFDATGTKTTEIVTETTAKDNSVADSSFLAMGPIIGLSASYNVNPTLTLYTKVGYAPVLIGSTTTNTTNTNTSKILTTTTPVNGAKTTQSNEGNTTTSNMAIAGLSGTETIGSIGAGYKVGMATLIGEGTARAYNLGGVSELVYGLKLGAGFNF
ncbi:hypothetical protein J7643_10635 [bacterium]|nr:hypothetical protein [bacterium]